MASQSLRIKTFTFHFPSGYEFKLKIPQEITVYEITQIMKSYHTLHRNYGLKHERQQLFPKCLTSLDRNIVQDIFLSSQQCWHDDLSFLINNNFRVFYGVSSNISRKDNLKYSPTQRYQIYGKVEHFEQQQMRKVLTIARCRQTGKMMSIKSISKDALTFEKVQNLIKQIEYCYKVNTECSKTFQQVAQIFETKNTVCIVNKLMPFNLKKLKIQNKYLMDLIISQVAKLLHTLIRDIPDILPNQISLSHFFMDFQFHVFYTGHFYGDIHEQSRSSSNQQFNAQLTYLVQELLKNSTLKVIQYYIPLVHWLKNKRIKNYLDFIKHFQVEGVNNEQNCMKEKQKKKIINCWLIQYYTWPKIIPLSQSQSLEFFQSYLPKTNMFSLKQKISNMKIKQEQIRKVCEFQSIENISTVKKRKESVKCAKELLQAAQMLRQKRFNQIKTKSKKKKCQINTKVAKAKSHKRVISQFLIDD